MGRSTTTAYSNDLGRFADLFFRAIYFRHWSQADIQRLLDEWMEEKAYHRDQQEMTDRYRRGEVDGPFLPRQPLKPWESESHFA